MGFTSKIGNNTIMSPRLLFLGVLYAGPQLTVTGEIIVVDVPTVQTEIVASKMMMNLGFVIKADRIMEFQTLFKA